MTLRAVLFDFSGTLFRLEPDDGWFAGIEVDGRAADGDAQNELARRLTQPTGSSVEMTPEQLDTWANRDLSPQLHRRAYRHVLRESGLRDQHAESLYARAVDPTCWTPYPDTGAALTTLQRKGIRAAVVSNISFDVRPAFAALGVAGAVDEFVLSFEVGAVKPDPRIFELALHRLGVTASDAVMVGDSAEADGAAADIGCRFVLVEPLPTAQRVDGLLAAIETAGIGR